MSGILLDALAFISIGLLGMGVFFKHRDRYLLRSAGYATFGLFWALRAPEFSHDMVNYLFAILALPFFLVIGLEEYRTYRGKPGKRGMEMLVGGIFLGFLIYTIISKIPLASGFIINPVAKHSTILLNILGGEYTAGAVTYPGPRWYTGGFLSDGDVSAPILDSDGWAVVNIILACTGIQSMMVFAGPILFTTRAQLKERISTILIILPVIYLLNLFRNAGIVILLEKGYSFQMAHDVIGKLGSLGALFVLALLAFKLVPGLLDDVNDILDIFTRQKPRSQP